MKIKTEVDVPSRQTTVGTRQGSLLLFKPYNQLSKLRDYFII